MVVVNYYVDRKKAYDKSWELGRHGARMLKPVPPRIENLTDAGIDLFSPLDFDLSAHETVVVDTFVVFEMPFGSVGLIWPRGGDRHLIGAGVIDEGYRGTIKVRVINPYATPLVFMQGGSLGQMVIVPRISIGLRLAQIHSAPDPDATERGDNGRINLKAN